MESDSGLHNEGGKRRETGLPGFFLMEYRYTALITDIHDADTITVDINLASLSELCTLCNDASRIDLGFSIDIPLQWGIQLANGEQQLWLRRQRVRFYGINAPELKTAAGIAARDYLRSLISVGQSITLQTLRVRGQTKEEKYGRYLGLIFLGRLNLNQHLIDKGYAVPFMI